MLGLVDSIYLVKIFWIKVTCPAVFVEFYVVHSKAEAILQALDQSETGMKIISYKILIYIGICDVQQFLLNITLNTAKPRFKFMFLGSSRNWDVCSQ